MLVKKIKINMFITISIYPQTPNSFVFIFFYKIFYALTLIGTKGNSVLYLNSFVGMYDQWNRSIGRGIPEYWGEIVSREKKPSILRQCIIRSRTEVIFTTALLSCEQTPASNTDIFPEIRSSSTRSSWVKYFYFCC